MDSIYDASRLTDNLKLMLADNAKSFALQAAAGFVGDDKFWCKQTYGSMILEALTSPNWLTESQQKSLMTMYQTLKF